MLEPGHTAPPVPSSKFHANLFWHDLCMLFYSIYLARFMHSNINLTREFYYDSRQESLTVSVGDGALLGRLLGQYIVANLSILWYVNN